MLRDFKELNDLGSISTWHLNYQELADYVDGRLSHTDLSAVQLHLARCRSCAEEISDLELLKAELGVRERAKRAERIRNPRFWIFAGAAAATLLAGFLLWQHFNSPQYLLAAAYTEMRPFEYRLNDKGYSPIRQQRAAEGTSALDKPDSLPRAEIEITQKLNATPEAPSLLLLRGRAQLLKHEYNDAIESLTRAQELNPADPAILSDLGCALALRGAEKNRPIDLGHALDALAKALKAKPGQPIALFNIALVYERHALFDDATEAWKQFLSVEKDADWAKEAQRHLSGIDTIKSKRDQNRKGVNADPSIFLTRFRTDPDRLTAELFEATAWANWLPQIGTNSDAREAFHTLAQLFQSRYHDPSLLDAWNAAAHAKDSAPLQLLADAIVKDRADRYQEAMEPARSAAQELAAIGNTGASLRARLEFAISRQRTSADECFAAADPLVKDLERTSYIWMHGQALLERSVCNNTAGNLEKAMKDAQTASDVLQEGPFPVLQLRAQGFLGNFYQKAGNLVGVWEIVDQGLLKCWQSGAPPSRAQQFDYDLEETCKRLGWDQAAQVFSNAAVREVSLTGHKSMAALMRVYAGPHSAHSEAELTRAEALLHGPNISSTDRNLLLDARLTHAETDPAESPATLEPAQSQASWSLQARLMQTLGRSLAATGDDKGATLRYFPDAVPLR